jgi:hypothetical protein
MSDREIVAWVTARILAESAPSKEQVLLKFACDLERITRLCLRGYLRLDDKGRVGVILPTCKIMGVRPILLSDEIRKHGAGVVAVRLECGFEKPLPQHIDPKVGAWCACEACLVKGKHLEGL